MKNRYRLFKRRRSVFYCFDNKTQRYASLHTHDRDAARQIVEAKNLALRHAALSREIGKAYLITSDPQIRIRTALVTARSAPRLVYLGGAMGVNAWLIKGFFDTIPMEIDESAKVDGATHGQVFWGIILPLAVPVLAVVGLLSFIGTINEFIIASALIQTPETKTLAVGLQGFIANEYSENWGPFAAGALLAAIPVVILFLFLQKFIVSGLTAGSVKG